MKIYTIGFTKKTAEKFFTLLRQSSAKRIVDVRLNNVSQLAGYAKKNDLQYFLKELCGMEYIHIPILAPTKDILDAYKKSKEDWDKYQRQFMELLSNRKVEEKTSKEIIADGCLLCSEHLPEKCHRRLVAEYFREKWNDVEIYHLY